MKKRILIAGLVVTTLLVLGWGGLAIAEGHGHARSERFADAPFEGIAAAIHARASIGRLVHELDLDAEQRQHLETVHTLIADAHQNRVNSRSEHMAAMLTRVEEGQLDPADARAVIDERLETLRVNLYAVADELVALVDSLDEEQRATLQQHLEGAVARAEARQADGWGHGRIHGWLHGWHDHHSDD